MGLVGPMRTVVRLAILLGVFFLLLGVVVALGSSGTGAVEKAALLAIGAALLGAAALVRARLG